MLLCARISSRLSPRLHRAPRARHNPPEIVFLSIGQHSRRSTEGLLSNAYSLITSPAFLITLRCISLQVGDAVWSVLPGETALTATRITGVRRIVQPGFVSVHTLQG